MTTITSHFTGKIAAIKEAGMSSGPQWHTLHLGPCPGRPSCFCGLTPVTLHVGVRCPRWAWWASLSVRSASHFSPTVSSLWNPFQSGFCPKQSSYHACVVLHFAPIFFPISVNGTYTLGLRPEMSESSRFLSHWDPMLANPWWLPLENVAGHISVSHCLSGPALIY